MLKESAAKYSGVYRRIHTHLNVRWALEQTFPLSAPTEVKEIKVALNPNSQTIPCKAVDISYHSPSYFPHFDLSPGRQANLSFRLLPQPVPPLQLPVSLCPLVVTVSYSVESQNVVLADIPLYVNFTQRTDDPPVMRENVYVHFYCAKAKEALEIARGLCRNGEKAEARQRLEDAFEIFQSNTEAFEKDQDLEYVKEHLKRERDSLE